MPAERPPGSKRWIKIVALVLAGVLVLGCILVAAAPMLVSAGLGQGFVRGAIEKHINGTVEFEGLSVSWLGDQSVNGLVIRDARGATVADVNARLNASLVALIRGVAGAMEIDLDGAVQGELREDGSLSLSDLARPGPEPPPRRPNEPPTLGGLGPTKLRLNGMQVTMKDVRDGTTYVLQDLTGTLAYVPGGTSNVRLVSGLRAGDVLGSIDIEAVSDGLFDRNGVLDVDGAVVRSAVKLRNVPVPRYDDQVRRINALDLDLVTNDLARRLDVSARLDTLLPSGDVSVLEGQLAALEPVSPVGRPTISMERLTGSVRGRDVPTALLAPLLADTPVDPVRDLGPTITVDADFSEGESKQVQINLNGANVGLVLAGVVNARDRTVVGDRLELTTSVHPELLAAVSPYGARQPLPLTLNLSYFSVPPLDEDGAMPLDRIHAAGSLILDGTAGVYRRDDNAALADVRRFDVYFSPETLDPGAPIDRWAGSITVEGVVHEAALREHARLPADRPAEFAVEISDLAFDSPLAGGAFRLDTVELRGSVTIDGPVRLLDVADDAPEASLQYARVQLDAPRLRDGARVQGSAGVVGGSLTFDEQLSGFLDADGRLDLDDLVPIGLVELRGVKPQVLTRFVPEMTDVIETAASGPMSARVLTTMSGDDPQARLFVFGRNVEASAAVTRRPDGLRVSEGTATIRVTPALLSVLQAGAEEPVTISGDTIVEVTAEPVFLPGSPPAGYALGSDPIRTRLAIDRVVLPQVPSLTSGLDVRGLAIDVAATLADPVHYDVDVVADIRDAETGGPIAGVRADLGIFRRGRELRPEGDVELTAVEVAAVERLLGLAPGTASDWTGPTGRVAVNVVENAASYEATLTADLPTLRGQITGTRVGGEISIGSKDLRLTLRRDVLQRRLNPPESGAAPSAGAPPEPRLRIGDHVPVRIAIESLRLPEALLRGEAFDPAAADIRVKLTTDAIHLADAQGTRSTLRDLSLAVLCRDLRTGIEAKLLGTADVAVTGPETGASGEGIGINVTSRVTRIVGMDSKLHPEQAKLELNADVSRTPTAIADALLNLQGLLVAAVGPSMNADFTARDFSADSGSLDARIETTYGWLEGQVTGGDQALHIASDAPVRAQLELSRPLRERLLAKVSPLFKDVRSAQDPVQFALAAATIPADGDVSRLNADLELIVGDVKIDKGSLMLVLMLAAQQSGGETIDGRIDTIHATITDGVLEYETFRVQIDKWAFDYTGTVNLVTKRIDLRTEIPLAGLALSIKELRGYADKISVPVLTRGTFDDYKTEVDPDFDLARAAAEAGFRGALDELLKGGGKDPLGDILGDILGGGKKP